MSNLQISKAEDDDIFNDWQSREPTEEDILNAARGDLRDRGLSEQEIWELTTIVIDHAEGSEITYKKCKGKYGENIAKELLQAKRGKELAPEILKRIEDIHNGALASNNQPSGKKARNGIKRIKQGKNKKQYVPMPFELIYDSEFRQFFKSKYLTYAFLRCYIVRGPMKNDPLNLYENYFLKGKLASSWTINKLASQLNYSPTTIIEHLKDLKRKGCLKVVPVPRKHTWDNQKHNIYILGTHEGNNKNPKYFIDDAFGLPSVPEGQEVQ